MNILQKLLLRGLLSMPEKYQFAMTQIDAMRALALDKLDKKWKLKGYQNLEKARLLAQEKEHWLGELQILMDQVSIIIREQQDKEFFYAANERLLELSDVFDMDDEAFASKFNEKYRYIENPMLLAQVDHFLRGLYVYFSRKADFMRAHLQHPSAILCGKAICKIASLSDVVSLEEQMETLFQIAIGYGNCREFPKAMEYYDKALHLAQAANDRTYEYISIMRKLSICISAISFSIHADVDQDRISVVRELLTLCDRYKLNPYEIGQKLLSEEDSELRKGGIREAMPSLYNFLALERGDWQTASLSTAEIKEAESKAYGSNPECSNLENLKLVYQLLHNPAARERSASNNQDMATCAEDDQPYEIPFPPEKFPADKFNLLLFYSKAEIARDHPNCSKSLALDAFNIADKAFSDYHIVMAYHAIGQAYEGSGDAAGAIDAYETIIDVFKNARAGSNISLSRQLMYNCLFEVGNLQKHTEPHKAIDRFTEALDQIGQATDVDKDFFKLHTLIERSVAYRNVGQTFLADNDIIEAVDMVLEQTYKRLRHMDGDLRDNYWNEVNKIIQRIVSLCDDADSDTLRKKVYELVLFSKGFLLNAEHALKVAVSSENVPENIRRVYEELEEYEQRRNPWGTSTENSSDEYVNHYLQRMRLTCAMSDVIDQYLEIIEHDYSRAVECLNDDEVVIDFYNYAVENNDQQYVAFVYRKGYGAPRLFKTCKESDIQNIFNEVAALLQDNGQKLHFTETYNPELGYSNELFKCILGEILDEQNIDPSFNIYLSAAGSLHKIPVESLVMFEEDQCIVSDHFKSVVRISHASVLKNKDVQNAFEDIELFGGLDYSDNSEISSGDRGYTLSYETDEITPLLPWSNLPSSLQEVNNIAFIWESAVGKESVVTHTHGDGTADCFNELSSKPSSIIHLATHGFFETQETAVNLPALKGRFSPMDLSGLFMSNGNKGWLYGTPVRREGILTSSDIASMDLRGTSLVVLSACNSGNGLLVSDEMYGLQRAFKKAGVKTVVMSLWNEPDVMGSMFMTRFYHNLLVEKLSLRDAFNEARREVRNRFPHPLYWANYLMLD